MRRSGRDLFGVEFLDDEPVGFTITVPAALWMSQNDRIHHFERARRTKTLRRIAAYEARNATRGRGGFTPWERVLVSCTVSTRTRTRFDPANAYPVAKALVDGIVDAGLVPDDDSEHVLGPVMSRGDRDASLPQGGHRVSVQVLPVARWGAE